MDGQPFGFFGYIKCLLLVSTQGKEGFLGGSDGKESACNAGDLGSIPGLERFPGEGKGYPLQYSGLENSMDCIIHGVAQSWHDLTLTFRASLIAQMVKNPPAMRETWVRSLGWKDPLEKGKATHSSILAWRIPWTIYSSWDRKEYRHD